MSAFNKTIDPAGGVNNAGITDLGNGLQLYCGTGVFTTTGATVIINHPFGTGVDILSAVVSPMCASGSEDQQDQPLYFTTGTAANTLTRNTTYGTLRAVTPGKATIARLANGSTGMAFSVIMIGLARH